MYLEIDRTSRNPIRNQLYEQLLKRILHGELAPGTKLPSSRYLHEKLNISRNLILEVYEQLTSEGYLEGHHGRGTWVSESVALGTYVERHEITEDAPRLSRVHSGLIRFTCGIPDLRSFPVKKWKRSVDYAWALADVRDYSYPPVNGIEDLRVQISDYLLMTKGIKAPPETVIITSGTSGSLRLLALHFASSSGTVIMEDPVLDFARTIFGQNGYSFCNVPVDEWGLDCGLLPENTDAELIFVSPTHQFPLGSMLPAARRVSLVDYALRKGMYIIEDDYDSEFRYEGQPLRSLFLINSEVVIHAGTFSKNMAPSLRLGYLVVPEHLAPALINTCEKLMISVPAQTQTAMAHFMVSGAFVRHIASMKRLYRRKYACITGEIRSAFGSSVKIGSNAAGLHLYVTHEKLCFSADMEDHFINHGVLVDFESGYSSGKKPGGLLLGFGNLTEDKIVAGVSRLKKAVEDLL